MKLFIVTDNSYDALDKGDFIMAIFNNKLNAEIYRQKKIQEAVNKKIKLENDNPKLYPFKSNIDELLHDYSITYSIDEEETEDD